MAVWIPSPLAEDESRLVYCPACWWGGRLSKTYWPNFGVACCPHCNEPVSRDTPPLLFVARWTLAMWLTFMAGVAFVVAVVLLGLRIAN